LKSIALITGAGTGIGRLTAQALAENGWRVVLVGRRREPLEETAALLETEALVAPGDISRAENVAAIFESVGDRFGRLDLLFNNAGSFAVGTPIDEMPLEDWYKVLDANLNGSVLCARAAFAMMRRQDPQGGRIINNGSLSAHVPRPGSTAYSVTKHAITGLTKSLSLDGRPFNIACGQIDVGNALTDMGKPMLTGVPQADGSVRPEPTMDPRQVADAVVHMAGLPLETNVQFMSIMATAMPYIGRG